MRLRFEFAHKIIDFHGSESFAFIVAKKPILKVKNIKLVVLHVIQEITLSSKSTLTCQSDLFTLASYHFNKWFVQAKLIFPILHHNIHFDSGCLSESSPLLGILNCYKWLFVAGFLFTFHCIF